MATGRMRTRLALAVLLVGASLAEPVAAQSVPEGQSCGGLLCDMGVFGHKTVPNPAPRSEGPSPLQQAGAASPQPVAVRAPAVAETRMPAVRKRKHVARIAPKPSIAIASSKPKVPADPTTSAVVEPRLQASPPTTPTRPASTPVAGVPPTASEQTVVLNPFSQPGASSFGFKPLY